MPITVEHGGDIAPLAAFAALAAQMAGMQQPQQATARGGGGGGGGGGTRRHTMIEPTGGIRPGRPTAEQQMRLQMEMEGKAKRFGMEAEFEQQREEAKIQADQWKTEYTTKQKHRIATIQNGIEQARRSGNFSEAEMAEVERMGSMELMGINPTLTPKDDGQKQMEAWAAEGKGIGQEWLDEWGNVKTREADGTIKTQVSYDKTRVGHESRLQVQREKDLGESRMKLLGETVKEGGVGKETETSRWKPIQIEAMLEATYPWYREQRIRQNQEELNQRAQLQVEQQQQAMQIAEQKQQNNYMLEEARKQGVELTDKDMDLPAPVAVAQAQLRVWKNRYGGYDGLPDDLKLAWREAKSVMEQYAAGLSQAIEQGQRPQRGPVGQTVASESPIGMGRNVTPLNPSGHIFR